MYNINDPLVAFPLLIQCSYSFVYYGTVMVTVPLYLLTVETSRVIHKNTINKVKVVYSSFLNIILILL